RPGASPSTTGERGQRVRYVCYETVRSRGAVPDHRNDAEDGGDIAPLDEGPMAPVVAPAQLTNPWRRPRCFSRFRSGSCDPGRTTPQHRRKDRSRSPSAVEMVHGNATDSDRKSTRLN